MSDEKKKGYQPPPLKLANLGRALRKRARMLTKAEQDHHAGKVHAPEAYVEACEAELERLAIKYARVAFICNSHSWPDVD